MGRRNPYRARGRMKGIGVSQMERERARRNKNKPEVELTVIDYVISITVLTILASILFGMVFG